MKSLTTATLLSLLCFSGQQESAPKTKPTRATLTTVAIRAHDMKRMVAFYSEAFGARFREVNTSGLQSQFGTINGVTLKLVPLRKKADFQGFPSHQPGFVVPNIQRVIDLARKHGGRQESAIIRGDSQLHSAVRDPDGNTIEVYQPVRATMPNKQR